MNARGSRSDDNNRIMLCNTETVRGRPRRLHDIIIIIITKSRVIRFACL